MSEDVRVELARKALAASKADDDTAPGTRGHRDALAMWGELEAALAALLDYLAGEPETEQTETAQAPAAPYAPGQRVTDTEGSVCATCGNDKWEFTGPHPMEPTTVGMFRCNRHGGHPLAIPYSTVTPVVQQTVADLTITEARGMLADSRADKAELTGNDRLLADRWWGRLHNEVELLLTLIDERAEQEPPGEAVTQADEAPPCPVEWCIRVGPVKPGHTHVSKAFSGVSTGYTVVILQLMREAPEINLFGDSKDTSVELDAAQARMLAGLTRPPIAEALRKAAGELDRITSGGGQ